MIMFNDLNISLNKNKPHIMKKTLLFCSVLALALVSFTTLPSTTVPTDSDKTIVQIAAGNENFSTLVAAVKAAGLVETLNGSKEFTVFAPTNDAFNKLPKGTVASLILPENKAKLTDILTYHVVAGEVMAKDVVAGIKANNGTLTVNTVKGEQLSFMMKGNNVMIKDAKGGMSTIIMTDVDASNGVIHAIDTVLMPGK
jgi:uncharacterized surface protein with fasciclin (FAS1) repeats